MFIIIIIF